MILSKHFMFNNRSISVLLLLSVGLLIFFQNWGELKTTDVASGAAESNNRNAAAGDEQAGGVIDQTAAVVSLTEDLDVQVANSVEKPEESKNTMADPDTMQSMPTASQVDGAGMFIIEQSEARDDVAEDLEGASEGDDSGRAGGGAQDQKKASQKEQQQQQQQQQQQTPQQPSSSALLVSSSEESAGGMTSANNQSAIGNAFGTGNGISNVKPAARSISLAYFLQISHSSINQAWRLLERVYHPRNVYMIHVDRQTEYRRFRHFRDKVQRHPLYRQNVMFMPRRPITYRGISMVLSTLAGTNALLRVSNKWDYLINISGSDYPLLSASDTLAVFDEALGPVKRGLNFIHFWDETHSDRWRHIHLDPALSRNWGKNINLIINPNTRRPIFYPYNLNGFRFMRGSAWMVISREFADFTVHDDQAREFLAFFVNTKSSPESFFHTLIEHARDSRVTPMSFADEVDTDEEASDLAGMTNANGNSNNNNMVAGGKTKRAISTGEKSSAVAVFSSNNNMISSGGESGPRDWTEKKTPSAFLSTLVRSESFRCVIWRINGKPSGKNDQHPFELNSVSFFNTIANSGALWARKFGDDAGSSRLKDMIDAKLISPNGADRKKYISIVRRRMREAIKRAGKTDRRVRVESCDFPQEYL